MCCRDDVLLAPQPARTEVDLLDGLQVLWNPAVLLGVQLCWILIFFYTGRSRVTAASMSFSVMRDRI